MPTLVLGASFGVFARPVMGEVAPIAMSVLVFSGSAQFAVLSVLQNGGGMLAATSGGLLMNARWLPMSFALAPSLRGRTARRVLETQAIVDASFILANRGDGSFDSRVLVGATIPQALAWVLGTAIGVVAADADPDPTALGLDAVFPAFYLALFASDVPNRRGIAAAGLAGAITLALLPWAPPGVPVLVASSAALLGLRRA